MPNQRWHPGDVITTSRLNGMVAGLLMRIVGGAGIEVTRSQGQLVISAKEMAGNIVTRGLPTFEITAINDDYIDCVWVNPVDSTTGGAIAVAKPVALQRTPFDGLSVTYQNGDVVSYVYTSGRERTATLDALSETQYVVPDYYVGEWIRGIPGVTGVLDGSANPIYWQDINTAARTWGAL